MRGQDDTSRFLDNIIASAPRQYQGTSNSGPSRTDPTTNFDRRSHYGTLAHCEDQKRNKFLRSRKAGFATFVLYFLNTLMGILGIAMIIYGAVSAQKNKNTTLQSTNDPFSLGIIIVGVVLLALSIYGCISTKIKKWFLFWPYTALLIILSLLLLAISITLIITAKGDVLKNWSQTIWKNGVKDHTEDICSLQRNLKCSGFTSNCTLYIKNVTIADNIFIIRDDNSTLPDDCPLCNNVEDDRYPESCWPKVRDNIKTYQSTLLGVSLGSFVAVVILIICSIYIGRRMKPTDAERRLYQSI